MVAEIKNRLSLRFRWFPRDKYKKKNTRVLVVNTLPPLPRKHDWVSPDKFLIKPKNHFSHHLSDVPNFCRVSL